MLGGNKYTRSIQYYTRSRPQIKSIPRYTRSIPYYTRSRPQSRQNKARDERYNQRIYNQIKAKKKELKRIYSEKTINTKEDVITREVHETILNEKDQLLIRQPSIGPQLRNPLGTTSCRHLQMLFLLYELANCIANMIGGNVRQILSQLWHGAIEADRELNQFYSFNQVVINFTNVTPDFMDSNIFRDCNIFPMGLITLKPDGGYHIFHYFILLREGDRYYIYNANGSDTLHAHPMKIEISLAEYKAFIHAVINNNKEEMDLFILTYFMEGATMPFYFDEGCNRTKYVSINDGKKIELAHYNNFSVVYFPTLRQKLITAAIVKFLADIRIKYPRQFGNPDVVIPTFERLMECITFCGPELEAAAAEAAAAEAAAAEAAGPEAAGPEEEEEEAPENGSNRGGSIARTRKKTKNIRLKLKAASMSRKMKR